MHLINMVRRRVCCCSFWLPWWWQHHTGYRVRFEGGMQPTEHLMNSSLWQIKQKILIVEIMWICGRLIQCESGLFSHWVIFECLYSLFCPFTIWVYGVGCNLIFHAPMKISGCMIKRVLASAGPSELWGRQTGSWAIKGECSAYVGVFSVATDAGKPFCGRLVFYICTPDIFTFTLIAPPHSHFHYPQVMGHVCMYLCVCVFVCL